MNKSFDKQYRIELERLKLGVPENYEFRVGEKFFSQFEHSIVKEGNVKVEVELTRASSHIEANFNFSGHIGLNCDRCLELYNQPVDFTQRIIYSFDPEVEFDKHEVIIIDRDDDFLDLTQEIYDYINLQVPLRKVPSTDIHLCPPEVLNLLGLDEKGDELEDEGAVEETDAPDTDPRWAELKKLKKKNNK